MHRVQIELTLNSLAYPVSTQHRHENIEQIRPELWPVPVGYFGHRVGDRVSNFARVIAQADGQKLSDTLLDQRLDLGLGELVRVLAPVQLHILLE